MNRINRDGPNFSKKIRTAPIFFVVFFLVLSFTFSLNVFAAEKPEDKNMPMESPFGVLEFLHWNHDWNNYKYCSREDVEKSVALMKKAGVSIVRMDFLWEDIEPEQGQFNFTKYDMIVDVLTGNNIKILGLLNYCAGWASPCGQWNQLPADNTFFVNYASKVIARYKDRIKYWEVWNEPDSGVYWLEQDGLKSYCRLLKDVYVAAKKIDPECKILNGGLANGLTSVNRLYENGAKDYFDILNIHYFDNPLNPERIKAVVAYPKLAYKIMSRNGDAHKKIWITEIGSPGVKSGIKTGNWWIGKNPDEQEQAEWLDKVYAELLKDKNVEKIFWAFFRDCNDHWLTGVDYFGMVRWDFSKKPAFFNYQKRSMNWKRSFLKEE